MIPSLDSQGIVNDWIVIVETTSEEEKPENSPEESSDGTPLVEGRGCSCLYRGLIEALDKTSIQSPCFPIAMRLSVAGHDSELGRMP